MKNSNQVAYELSLKFYASQIATKELLKLILYRAGIKEEEIIEYSHHLYGHLLVYFKLSTKALKIYKLLRFERIRKVNIKIKKLLPKSWKIKGAEEFKPFKLTKRLYVSPQKDRKQFRGKEHKTIFLASGLAFGTGLHETTRFMAQLIEEYIFQVKTFLDIGTGTGILSLVALKNGIKNIRAIDISKDCVKAARGNLVLNKFKPNGINAIGLNKLKSSVTYDFVAANLITRDLITHQKEILSLVSSGGFLAVSGISLENYSFLRDHFRKLPLKCIKIIKGKEWAAILFRKLVK